MPVSGNRVLLWLNDAGVHAVVVWQVSHVVGKPAASWLGLAVRWYLARWHPEHRVGVPAKTLFTWHCEHCAVLWLPVRAKLVRVLWSNLAGRQAAVVWHREQSCGNPPATWFGLAVR